MPPAKTTMASKFESAAEMNGGYVASSAPMYVDASIGVEVRSRSNRVAKAHRLTQVARRGVTGRQAESRVKSPAPTIQVMGYRKYFEALYTPYQIGVRSIAAPTLADWTVVSIHGDGGDTK